MVGSKPCNRVTLYSISTLERKGFRSGIGYPPSSNLTETQAAFPASSTGPRRGIEGTTTVWYRRLGYKAVEKIPSTVPAVKLTKSLITSFKTCQVAKSKEIISRRLVELGPSTGLAITALRILLLLSRLFVNAVSLVNAVPLSTRSPILPFQPCRLLFSPLAVPCSNM